ncbi:MAG TPA: ROK family transcriptional regulator [Stellaceae bacterium]|nr:ROK family transcriptional regulator [Stellaceae bacterium]
MAMQQTGDTELIRAINRFHVLDAVRRFEPISRAEIGERARLSRTTVSAVIAALLDEGVIYYDDSDTPTALARGRPRGRLRMNPNAAYVVGVKLSMHQIGISVTNLRADPLASLVLPVRTWRLGAEVAAAIIEDGIRAALVKAQVDLGSIAGIGVGIPGFIDAVTGISHWSPILGAQPVPFAEMLSQRLGVPTVIENDANLVTLAERWFGYGQDVDNFIVVTVEAGIGMGLFMNGDLYRGHHGMGTELGHVKIDRGGPQCRCGQFGCIEAFASDSAILREAMKLVDIAPVEDDAEAELAMRRITELARRGDAGLLKVFKTAGEILGIGIANLVNVLDPAKVIIAGSGMRAADLLGPSITAAINANCLAVLNGRCEVFLHNTGDEVGARGAASLVLQGLYRVPWQRSARLAVAL